MENFNIPKDINTIPYKNDKLKEENIFLAKGSQLMGDIQLKKGSSIWYNSVLRADINSIIIGEYSNIQDGSIIHVANDYACKVGNYVTIGHHVNLHGCVIEDYCLVGIGAIILNGAIIKSGAIIAAGAVVKENAIVPNNCLFGGIPAKQIKTLDNNIQETNKKWAEKYFELSQHHQRNE